MPEVSAALQERFRTHRGDAGHQEKVIITLRPDADPEQLERAGVRVERKMRSRPIVAGRLDAATLRALEGLDGVERVELDGEVRALGD